MHCSILFCYAFIFSSAEAIKINLAFDYLSLFNLSPDQMFIDSGDQTGGERELYIFTRTKVEHVHDNSNMIHIEKYVSYPGRAVVGGAEAGLYSRLRGHCDDVGSLPVLVHVQANQTDVLVHRPLQQWPLHDGCGAPAKFPDYQIN